ncbi:MAG: hypothetical protein AAFV53_33070 [Myxococcota bacterium]
MPVYAALPNLYPPHVMLSRVLEIAKQEGDSFGRVEVTLLLHHGHRLRGVLMEVVPDAEVGVVVLEASDGASFVPTSTIVAARLHPDEAQDHRLRTGETMVEDTYADHRRRCWLMGDALSEDEVDFSVAEVELSVQLDEAGLPHDALASLMLDGFLDRVEQTLSSVIGVPGSRHALIFGCPTISIRVLDTDRCTVSEGTLHIPVQVRGGALNLLEDDALETQVKDLLHEQIDTIPEHWRSEGWYLVTAEADEQKSWLEGILGRTASFSLDETGLVAIDSDVAIEIRDMVRDIYASLGETHRDAVGEDIREIVLRRRPEQVCTLEDGVLTLPVVIDARWNVGSISAYEVSDELNRLLKGAG